MQDCRVLVLAPSTLKEAQLDVHKESSIKSLKEGQYCGFDPCLRKLSISSLSAHRTWEPILKVE